jgi:hypothetical protein
VSLEQPPLAHQKVAIPLFGSAATFRREGLPDRSSLKGSKVGNSERSEVNFAWQARLLKMVDQRESKEA